MSNADERRSENSNANIETEAIRVKSEEAHAIEHVGTLIHCGGLAVHVAVRMQPA
jgi:hypothetical protein